MVQSGTIGGKRPQCPVQGTGEDLLMAATDEDLVERANARVGALLKGKYTLDRVLEIGRAHV